MSAVDTLWVLLGAALVFFMQAGFAMVETGFTRAKNAGNIIMKNLMDFSAGTIVYWLIGFGIMYGENKAINALFGTLTPAVSQSTDWTSLIFQTVFCATAATIVSGAMAERTKFKSYLIYSIVLSAIVYPISGHWIWGGGWLASLGTEGGLLSGLGAYGFHDFAGSTVVHMVGGVAALVGAKILGARIGKYGKDGKARAIPGHSLTLGALGVFILWFGWFGFNGASSLAMEGLTTNVPRIFVTTNVAAAVAAVAVMAITWIKYKKPDVSMTLNGALAGLVAITAGCSTVTVTGAAIIGLIAGIFVVFGIEFIDKVLKIDDPVGAVGVHGISGALGTILVGVFAYYDPYTDADVLVSGGGLGLVYGGGGAQLLVQIIGVVAVAVYVAIVMGIVFKVIKATVGLRVSMEDEIEGLDTTEHGLAAAYSDFVTAPSILPSSKAPEVKMVDGKVAVEEAVPVQVLPAEGNVASDVKISKLSIICKQNRLELLKEALNEVGVTGLTVTQVLGCGVQKGYAEYYRGNPVELTLLPKIQVDVVVSKVPVKDVVEAATKALYTGSIGDGKIFIYDVENVIKVRTGEQGYEALQGDDSLTV